MVACNEGGRQPDSVRFRTLDFNLVAAGSNPSLITRWVASHADAFLARRAILPNKREEGTRGEALRTSAWARLLDGVIIASSDFI